MSKKSEGEDSLIALRVHSDSSKMQDKDDGDDKEPFLPKEDEQPVPHTESEMLFGILPKDAFLYVGVCACLCVQNTSYTLARRYVAGVIKDEATSQSILAAGEVMKFVFCFYMMFKTYDEKRQGKDESADEAEITDSNAMLRRLVEKSLPMAVPAGIFLAMNLLSFIALRRISASAFTLIQQSKIIATAILCRWFLDRKISPTKWRALGTLLGAVLVICHQTHPDTLKTPNCDTADGAHGAESGPGTESAAAHVNVAADYADYMIGVVATIVECILSGMSNVYFEKVLKTTSLSVWERNVQLAGWSILIYFPMAIHASPSWNPLYGWSGFTCVVSVLGALGGVLVALVINYCDSISKNLAVSAAIILTALLDYQWFDGPMNLPIIAAAGIVILSILNYTQAS